MSNPSLPLPPAAPLDAVRPTTSDAVVAPPTPPQPSDHAQGPASAAPILAPEEGTAASGFSLPTRLQVRNLSLAVLAVLASLMALRWSASLLIPIAMGVLMSYALTPIVDRLQRWGLPRALGAAMVVMTLVGSAGGLAYAYTDDAIRLVQQLPDTAEQLRKVIRGDGNGAVSAIAKVQEAAEKIAVPASATPAVAPRQQPQRVQVERPRFDLTSFLWTGTLGLFTFLGQATMVCLMAGFLLASGNTFRRKLVSVVGTRWSEKRITVELLDGISSQIQIYLLVQLAISVGVGIVTWLVYLWIGVPSAAVWGIAAGVLNLIPYVGPLAITGASAVIGFAQLGSMQAAVLIVVANIVIHFIAGHLLVPWLSSRTARMNAVSIFVGLMVWGWLWGVWGLLLGVPIMMVFKSICDRVEDLKTIGVLLGE